MTAKWIQEAAEERYADYGEQFEDAIAHATRTAFIAGVELGIAKAAQAAGGFEPKHHVAHVGMTAARVEVARAIRALGSDNEEE